LFKIACFYNSPFLWGQENLGTLLKQL
jgi:hypothetical protein